MIGHYAAHIVAIVLLVIRSRTILRLEHALGDSAAHVDVLRRENLEWRASFKRLREDPRTLMREASGDVPT